jgi:hypothetical protein
MAGPAAGYDTQHALMHHMMNFQGQFPLGMAGVFPFQLPIGLGQTIPDGTTPIDEETMVVNDAQ